MKNKAPVASPTSPTSTPSSPTSTPSSLTSSPPQLQLDAQLCFAIAAAARAMTGVYAPLLEPLGLTYPQYLVMLVLWEKSGQRVTDIGTRLHLDSGTLTPLLKRLEARGLVTRRRASDDERVVVIDLTDEGRALRQPALKVPEAMACKVGLDEQRFVALREQLVALTASLRS